MKRSYSKSKSQDVTSLANTKLNLATDKERMPRMLNLICRVIITIIDLIMLGWNLFGF